jgi:copper(I)-binding protein
MSSTARSTLALLALAVLPIAPARAQDYNAGSIRIEAPWLRATPSGAKVAGGYMKLHNTGGEVDRLVGGSSPVAGAFEVHEMRMDGSVMTMRELPNGLDVPPGKTVELKPGSYHIMLIDLRQTLKAGDRIKGTLRFEKAGTIEVEYTVRGIGSHGGSHGSSGAGAGHDSHGSKKH